MAVAEHCPRPLSPSDGLWRLAAKRASPLVLLNNGGGDNPLYCIHSITGDVAGLHSFASVLRAHRVYGIQVSKEQMNAGFAGSIEAMATRYADLLTAFQPEGGISLAGWSAGAVIALETAQQLRARGRDVPLLVAVDGAPCNTGAGLKRGSPRYLWKVLANLPAWIRADLEEDWSLAGFARRIEFKLAYKFGGASAAVKQRQTLDADRVKVLLSSSAWSEDQKGFIHAMYKAVTAYVPKPYVGRVLVYETQTQPLYHLRQIGAAWRKIAPLAEIVPLQGNHSEISRERTIRVIARDVFARAG